jgi:uncharacterized protein
LSTLAFLHARALPRWTLAVLLWLATGWAAAQALVPVPALTARVIDQTATLSDAQRQALEARLAAFEAAAGTQIAVLMVPTTLPEDIADYTQRVGDAWKIGRRDVGDGLLIVVAKNDRRMRIAPAKALEGAVPDLAAKQIIDRQMTPAFRAGDFAGGLNAAVDQLQARIRGEALPAPPPSADRGNGRGGDAEGGFNVGGLAVFFFISVPIVGAVLRALLGRKLGALATGAGAGALAWLVSASVLMALGAGLLALLLVGVLGAGGRRYGSGGWGGVPIVFGGGSGSGGFSSSNSGFSSSSSGFQSGGGGDFGGGGASGNW